MSSAPVRPTVRQAVEPGEAPADPRQLQEVLLHQVREAVPLLGRDDQAPQQAPLPGVMQEVRETVHHRPVPQPAPPDTPCQGLVPRTQYLVPCLC